MFVSLAAALAAAFCYGIGAVMQAIAVRAASRRPVLAAAGMAGRVDPGLVLRMFRQWPFVLSLVIDFVGFVCQLIALRRLPIFEVQVIIAANLAVTAVFASWLMHTVLSAREWAAVLAVVVGVGLLGSSAGGQGAASVGIDFHLGLITALAAIAVVGVAAARLPSQYRTPALGAVAGLGYGVLAICARILPGFTPDTLIESPAAYTLAAAGIISFMLYASALESGSVTVATASVILFETVPPALIGVLFLGDTTKPGLLAPAIAGFLLALISAIALARFGEAGVQKDGDAEKSAEALRQVEALTSTGRSGSRQADPDGTEDLTSRPAPSVALALTGAGGIGGPVGSARRSGSADPAGSAGPAVSRGSAEPGGPGGSAGSAGSGSRAGSGDRIGSVGPAGPNGAAGWDRPLGSVGPDGPNGLLGQNGPDGAISSDGLVGAGPDGSAVPDGQSDVGNADGASRVEREADTDASADVAGPARPDAQPNPTTRPETRPHRPLQKHPKPRDHP